MLLLISGGATVNTAPVVDAGPTPLAGTVGIPLFLNGSVTDDGLPSPPGVTTALWTKISGVGIATFDDATDPTTNVSVDTAGTYVFQLAGDDSVLQSTDTVTVTFTPPAAGGGGGSRFPWLDFIWH